MVDAEAKDDLVRLSPRWTEDFDDSEREKFRTREMELSIHLRNIERTGGWKTLRNSPHLKNEASIRNIRTYGWSLASLIRGLMSGLLTRMRF